jgi:preprotein translocase subunit SecD
MAMAAAYLLPSVVDRDKLPNWFSRYFNKQILKGLDLAGGVYLEYHVEIDEAVEDKMERIGDDIRSRMLETLRSKTKRGKDDMLEDVLRVESEGSDVTITVKGNLSGEIALAKKAAKDAGYMDTRNPVINLVTESKSTGRAVFRMDKDHNKKIEDDALRQARETIQSRVDEFGVSGADVMRREDAIVVELPGLAADYIKRVKTRLGAAARLDFKIVDDETQAFQKMATLFFRLTNKEKQAELGADVLGVFMEKKGGAWTWRPEYRKLSQVNVQVDEAYERQGKEIQEVYFAFPKAVKPAVEEFVRKVQETAVLKPFRIPNDREVGYGPDDREKAQAKKVKDAYRSYYLHRIAEVTGEYLDDAFPDYDNQNRPIVSFRFGRAGEKKFRDLTRKNIQRKMAIILDKEVKSAPVIQSEIGARGQITLGGMRSREEVQQEAKDLSSILKAGSLPAPMSLEFEQQVGPQLGADAIRWGALSFIIGAFLVVIFVIVYYRVAGVIAVVALVLNVIFILGILAAVEARLTLPGIAGIVLTLGMAVDANVIINERIREELRLGKTPRAAIETGYDRAFWTIFDSQLTTAIAGFVLMQYGSGPIKGFAVTLLIGIVCSVYCGVFVTRILFDLMVKHGKLERLSI